MDKKKEEIENIERFAKRIPWIVVIVSAVAMLLMILQVMFFRS